MKAVKTFMPWRMERQSMLIVRFAVVVGALSLLAYAIFIAIR